MRATIVLILASVICSLFGCGNSPDPQQQANTEAPANTASSHAPTTPAETSADHGFVALNPPKHYTDPQDTVRDFLHAITQGEDKMATSLLSYAAQRETWSNGLALSSDGFPGTRFQITAQELVRENEAHVETTWVDEHNNSYPCVWLLRNEQQGWRIFAMATKFMENADPVILPFEDHAELRRIQQQAVQQMQVATQQPQETVQASGQQPLGYQNGQVRQASGQQPLNR